MKKTGVSKEKKQVPATRSKRLVCCMSEKELETVELYLKKYKVRNKGRWMRETLLGSIYREMEANYPTLFEEHEMRR